MARRRFDAVPPRQPVGKCPRRIRERDPAAATVIAMPGLIAGIDPGRPDAAKSAVAPVALCDAAGRAGGPPGVWLLAPNDEQEARPVIDGRPVPVFPAAQWARVPREWLAARRSAASTCEAEYNH